MGISLIWKVFFWIDPYAKIIVNSIPNHHDLGLPPKYLGRLCKEPDFDWGGDVHLNLPMEKLVVYQLNVMRFTEHKSSKLPPDIAGTFSGVTEKVHHLKDRSPGHWFSLKAKLEKSTRAS